MTIDIDIETRQQELKRVNRQIVRKMEAGEDYSGLRQRRDNIRTEITGLIEDKELRKKAEANNAMQARAEAIKERVQKQDEAIDQLLALRDQVVAKLEPLVEPMKELARLGSLSRSGPGAVWEQFHDSYSFGAQVAGIRPPYLPEGFSCPILEIAPGTVAAYDKTAEAFQYFQWALGILSNLKKGVMFAHLKPADEDLDGLEDPENMEIELHCRVCNHEKAAEINKALKDGRALRDVETEFNVSKSTLHRHKNRCLNLGAVRIVD